jgi:Pyruvate/2-oxoacid:ferredoxin oxidoreductase delta subunit
MSTEDQLYRALQVHLDKETIGFPATESGSDTRLLRQLFLPDQAEAAMLLTYRYESIEQIHARSEGAGKSIGELEAILDRTARRGVIGYREKDGLKQYRNIPYIVGMGEAAAHNPTPEFISAAMEYSGDGTFWAAFLNTKISQMRVVPIEESVTPEHHIGSYDDIKNVIEVMDGPIAVIECVCRKSAATGGEPCQQTSRKETCMAFRDGARNLLAAGGGRELTKAEALEIVRKNEEDGLVLQPSNAQGPDFMCSCCGCCCGILKLHKAIPDPVSHWATNFYAAVDSELCSACGVCVESCQTDAMTLDEETEIPDVDLRRCLGCGNCVPSCPEDAIELRKKETEVIPPQTGEDMFEVLMTAN